MRLKLDFLAKTWFPGPAKDSHLHRGISIIMRTPGPHKEINTGLQTYGHTDLYSHHWEVFICLHGSKCCCATPYSGLTFTLKAKS